MKKEFTLEEIAKLTDSMLVGDPDYKISGYAELEAAKEEDISFLSNPRYTKNRYTTLMKQSRAGAIFISPHIELAEKGNFLVHKDPSKAFQIFVEAMIGRALELTQFPSIHPRAILHETCSVGKNVTIAPNAVIDAHTVIGDNTFIGAGAYIGPYTTIGKDCIIHPNVAIRESTLIGNRVVVQPGSVIGACGFGFSTDEKGVHTRIKQLGRVVIEDDVEIGANCTIDRARFTETRIGQGTKIDSNVVVGHNVTIGKNTLICGQSGIAGSTKIGNHVVIAGQCGVDGHLKIEDGVMISAKSGVTKSLSKGKYGGYPAQPIDEFNKTNVFIRQLEKYTNEVRELKSRLDQKDSI